MVLVADAFLQSYDSNIDGDNDHANGDNIDEDDDDDSPSLDY